MIWQELIDLCEKPDWLPGDPVWCLWKAEEKLVFTIIIKIICSEGIDDNGHRFESVLGVVLIWMKKEMLFQASKWK